MSISANTLLLGFISAALAVVTVHQGLVYLLDGIGLISRTAWSMAPSGRFQVPALLNAIFWGGLWGSLLAALYAHLPGGGPVIKGLIFGSGIYLFSNCLILPLLKGQPLFYGGNSNQLITVLIILAGFGIATAVIYNALQGRL